MNRVLMATACGRFPASNQFFDCFYGAELPEGSERVRIVSDHFSVGCNSIIKKALEENFDYTFYVDDDWLFPPDVVMRMLSHDKDIASPLVTMRTSPFRPCIYSTVDDRGRLGFHNLTNESGLFECLAGASCAGLVKTEVYKRIQGTSWFPNNFHDGLEHWSGDVLFSKKLIEAGIKTHIDLDYQFWHQDMSSVTARRVNDQWMTLIQVGGSQIQTPLVK